MIASLRILTAKNKTNSSIHTVQHFGKPMQYALMQHTVWQSIEQSITVGLVQMAQNHRMNKFNFERYRYLVYII